MTETDKRWLKWNWGVPDWRDRNAYPKPDDLTDDDWHWEFVRRRPDYREAWLFNAERTYRANVEKAETLDADDSRWREHLLKTMDDPDFYAKRWDPDEYQAKFWWEDYFRDPSAPPKQIDPDLGVQFDLAINRKTYGYKILSVEDARYHLPQKRLPGTPVRRIAITFDLAKPLKPQLEEVKATFENWRWVQRNSLEVEKDRRTRGRLRKLWPTYLQILDALDANPLWDKSDGPCPKFPGKQTWKAIGDAIFLDANLTQKEVDALIKNNPTQAAQDIYRAAKKLRDNFPF